VLLPATHPPAGPNDLGTERPAPFLQAPACGFRNRAGSFRTCSIRGVKGYGTGLSGILSQTFKGPDGDVRAFFYSRSSIRHQPRDLGASIARYIHGLRKQKIPIDGHEPMDEDESGAFA
jgi:hypothetical protein